MTTKPRPTLDSLSSRFARKDLPPPPAAPVPEPEAAPEVIPPPSAARPPKDTRVQILTRIDPATRKRLKVIAAEQDRTIQDICEEAIRDFVGRHSK
ncbi:ribbon-helix-helix domain-containing protein [Methylobacterium trifolii]|uniref:Antitoxin-like ribbon-helix-helix domain-containing protein n=1 Tax=Methylobacterium trifolii TaxID=1003092 RepID=A0ABQ4TZC9_9HYPH|nr:ribbon-helix-helix domain-containing protein [Methylobacterium trifolii]GJE59220.1 hypothetical protein MPOCJGCO_1308 [Methylobacterium trifolii]